MIFCVLQVFVCRQPQDRRFLLVNAGPEVGCGVKEHVTWWQYSTWLYKERVDMELTSRAYINSMNKNNYTDVRICQCLSFHWEKKINVTFPVYMYIDLVVCTKLKESIKSFLLLICFWKLICLERLSFIFGWLIVIIRMCQS